MSEQPQADLHVAQRKRSRLRRFVATTVVCGIASFVTGGILDSTGHKSLGNDADLAGWVFIGGAAASDFPRARNDFRIAVARRQLSREVSK